MSLPDADSVSDSRAVDKPHRNAANPRLEMPKIHRYIYKNLRLKSAQNVWILGVDFTLDSPSFAHTLT